MSFEIKSKKGKPPFPNLETVVRDNSKNTRFEPPRGTVIFEGVTFEDVDFSKTTFDHMLTRDSRFIECNFERVKFRYATLSHLPQSSFLNCRFDGADLRGVHLGEARFEGCSFRSARIEQWFSYRAEFIDCIFAGQLKTSKFWRRPHGARAERLDRTINEFRGNDFSDAKFFDVSFVDGVDLRLQRLPQSDEYVFLDRVQDRIVKVRKEVATWPDDTSRNEALMLLGAFSPEWIGSQDQAPLPLAIWCCDS